MAKQTYYEVLGVEKTPTSTALKKRIENWCVNITLM